MHWVKYYAPANVESRPEGEMCANWRGEEVGYKVLYSTSCVMIQYILNSSFSCSYNCQGLSVCVHNCSCVGEGRRSQ